MAIEITVRAAELRDLDWLTQNDGHLDRSTLAAKVASGEMLVAEIGGERAGLLRFDRLWSEVPFVALVRVRAATGSESQPQAWHRAIGFEECGELSGINADGVPEVVFRLAL